MQVKVFNCYHGKLEEEIQNWIDSFGTTVFPQIIQTNLTTTSSEGSRVCCVIFYE